MRIILIIVLSIMYTQNVFTQPDSLSFDFAIPQIVKSHNQNALKYYLQYKESNLEEFYKKVDSLLREDRIRGSFKRLLIDTAFKNLVIIPRQLENLVKDSFDFYIANIRPYFDNIHAESHFPLLKQLASNINLKDQVANMVLLSPKLLRCDYLEFKEDVYGLSQYQIRSILGELFKDFPERLIHLKEIACHDCLQKNLSEILNYLKYVPNK